LYIINPAAGRGRSRLVWKGLQGILEASGNNFQVAFTEEPGHGRELAFRAAREHVRKVVAVGGDGTVHEVVNGLAGSQTALGVIPAGTGNDFARAAGIPFEPSEALHLVHRARARSIDLGKVGGEYFINVAGVGFDAEVAAEVNRNHLFLPGAAAYVRALLQQMLRYRNSLLTVEVDGWRWEGRALFVAVGNAQYCGGGLRLVPTAVLDDGRLDLCLAGDISKLDLLCNLPRVFSGGHLSHPKVEIARGLRVRITSRSKLYVHADGEIVARTPVNLEVVPGAMKVLLPPRGREVKPLQPKRPWAKA